MNKENYELNLTMMIAHGGDANAQVFDALDEAKTGNYEKALEILENAQKELLVAQKYQFALLNEEADGEEVVPTVLMIHAMDICMAAANSIQYTKKLLSLFKNK